ncbi:hypothetical protein GCM10011332_23320 [Terasakiella brassicae]|uniref:Uncharacterized protein n=1 Tax=Terasakiella brassicae TaxID=1634917 RepID=A0A917FBV0_9PROT|nr:hypothetical protein [Terasakiella brassicae]GGF68502.1 hypothetical protein GCM10011332_23320 [Terasakiella brassicae]
MNADVRDDNLRLIFAKQEGEFIGRKIAYHVKSLVYAGITVGAFLLYLALLPLLNVLYPDWEQWFMAIAFGGFLIVFTVSVMAIFSFFKLRKYLIYRKNYQRFMKSYNRMPKQTF